MTNEEILVNLRAIARGDSCDSAEMKEILLAHDCTELAGRVLPSMQDKLTRLVTSAEVKERYKYAAPLFEALRDYPYAVIKGAVLSEQIYGSPFARRSGDLDVLIRRQDLDFAKRILLENGFVQGRVIGDEIVPFTRKELIFQASQSHQTAPFVKATDNKICPFINYDLNTSVFWGEYGQECDMDFVLCETREVVLFDIPFKTLTPEMGFISLCLHHYKDMNSIYLLAKGSLKLDLFCDIYFYLKNVALDMDKLWALSRNLNADPYIYYCLWYTNKVFDAEFLHPYLSRFESVEGASLLSTFGLCAEERHQWTVDFWDRLFSPTFREDFIASRSEKEREKIVLNQTFM